MDFHALPRRDLQALCKRNGVRANMTNVAMAEALASLPTVDGLEEFVKEPAVVEVVPPEKKGRRPCATAKSPEVIMLDDSDEEEKTEVAPEEKAHASLLRGCHGTVRSSQHIRPDDGEVAEKRDLNQDANEATLREGRRGASRRARAAPVVAPTTTRRARASTIETVDAAAAAAAPTAPAPRRRAQASTETAPTLQSIAASLAEEKVSRGRRTTRKAAARMPHIQSEEEEHLQDIVSSVETTETASVSDAGSDDAEEGDREPLWVEQNSAPQEPVQEEEEVTVENKGSAAHKCLSEDLAEEQEVDVEQPFNVDDSPILGLVSGPAAIEEGEDAPVCNNECSMDKLVAEESCDIISEEKETMPVDEVPEVTVTCSEATAEGIGMEASAETFENKGSAAHKWLSEALAEEQEVDVEQSFNLDDSEELDREQNSTPVEPVHKEEGTGVEASAETVEKKGSAAHKCLSEALAKEQEVDVEQPLSLDDSEEVDREPLWVEQNSIPEEPVQKEEGVGVEASAETVENKESAAHKCLSEALAEEQEVNVEQPFRRDDSPILGLVSGPAAIEEGEEAPVCKECSMDKLVAAESCDIITEGKEIMLVDEVPEVTVTCSEATVEAELPIGIGSAIKEVEVVNGTGAATEDNGAEIAKESCDITSEEKETMSVDEMPEATVTCSEATVEAEFPIGIDSAIKEVEAVNGTGAAAEDNGAETAEESWDIISEEKETMSVDEMPEATVTCSEATVEAEFPISIDSAIKEVEAVNGTGAAAEDNGAETAEESCDIISEEKETMSVDEVLEVTVTCSEATVEAVNGTGAAAEDNGAETAEESCDIISEEKETMSVDEVLVATVTCSEATVEAEFPIVIGSAMKAVEAVNGTSVAAEDNGAETVEESCDLISEEKETMSLDEVLVATVTCSEAVNGTSVAAEDNGAETVEESCDLISEEKETMSLDEVLVATVTCSEAPVEAEFPIGIGSAIKEVEAVNGTGAAAEDNEAETVEESCDTISEEKETMSVDEVLEVTVTCSEATVEAVNGTGAAAEDNGAETADEPHNTLTDDADNANSLSNAVEEVVMATEDVLQSSTTMQDDFNSEICHADEHKYLVTVERVSSDREEDISEENVSGDLSLKFDGPGYLGLGDHSADMFDNVADSLATSVIAAEAMVSEANDMPSDCMHSSSSHEKGSTELVAKEDGNAVILKLDKQKKPVELAKHSLGNLRVMLKEKLIANKRKDEKRVALARLDENVC
ncbi:hypothetical protein GUJ93_ZPchr0004g39860 [Zizania palustris]|uniref:Uncharacterized protein n=1 Tax=Zizania palustris TaxID=103762 RepID=A0A8J5SKN3_ZIZPA|nr:hypothetical protein GUJ93_ZPchr0004g39860 [Zizania palustris]